MVPSSIRNKEIPKNVEHASDVTHLRSLLFFFLTVVVKKQTNTETKLAHLFFIFSYRIRFPQVKVNQ